MSDEPKRDLNLLAEIRAHQFQESGNPVCAIESAIAALDAGEVPPDNVRRWIRGCFTKWHEAEGTISMDKIMELSGSYKRVLLDDRDLMLLSDISLLRCLGATIEVAAAMVARRAEATPDTTWNVTKHYQEKGIAKPLESTLIKVYKHWPGRDAMLLVHQNAIFKWTAEQRRQYLDHFPADSIPSELRNIA